MKKYLAIDQGTTSSRSIIFNSNLEKQTDSQIEYALTYPSDGWVELNPDDILNSVVETLDNVVDGVDSIEACGITNQRETTIIWSKISGKPIYPGIVWQDRRTSSYCNELKAKGLEEKVRQKTGLLIDPYFSATKIKWILDNVDGAREQAEKGNLAFGTVDSYLIYKLSKEKNHLTDVTNASRTLLYNIKDMQWDDDLLEMFDIPKSILPDVLSCDDKFGTLCVNKKEIPIMGVIGDQQAALVGQDCFKRGDMKSTYGTGCFLMVNTEDRPINIEEGMLTTIAYKINNNVHYALEGSIYSCGNIIQWLRDKMKFFKHASESEHFLNRNGDSNKVIFIPAFNGLGAPFWDSKIRASFYGITQDSSIENMITAAFHSITFQTKEITTILENNDIKINKLFVDGGMVANKTFCQVLANTLQKDIYRPENVESTALGACKVAMIASGESIKASQANAEIFKSDSDLKSVYENEHSAWLSHLKELLEKKD
ncbi:MAG: glycerol kinase [Gammaproteobacteria bacterium]|nr:glycerol kinase [Gammaproteobacteria bacterium]